MLNMGLLRVIHTSLSLFWGTYVAKDFGNKIPALLFQTGLYLLCAHGEISWSTFEDLLLKSEKLLLLLFLNIYISVFTFKGSVMALLSTVHVAVQRTWLNLLKQLNKAELLCLFNYRDSSLRVEAVVFCRAKTILGLKALALVSRCLSFVVIHL